MQVAIVYPNTESARYLAASLLQSAQYDVIFYCPSKAALDAATNIIFELNIIGKQIAGRSSRKSIKKLSTLGQ